MPPRTDTVPVQELAQKGSVNLRIRTTESVSCQCITERCKLDVDGRQILLCLFLQPPTVVPTELKKR